MVLIDEILPYYMARGGAWSKAYYCNVGIQLANLSYQKTMYSVDLNGNVNAEFNLTPPQTIQNIALAPGEGIYVAVYSSSIFLYDFAGQVVSGKSLGSGSARDISVRGDKLYALFGTSVRVYNRTNGQRVSGEEYSGPYIGNSIALKPDGGYIIQDTGYSQGSSYLRIREYDSDWSLTSGGLNFALTDPAGTVTGMAYINNKLIVGYNTQYQKLTPGPVKRGKIQIYDGSTLEETITVNETLGAGSNSGFDYHGYTFV